MTTVLLHPPDRPISGIMDTCGKPILRATAPISTTPLSLYEHCAEIEAAVRRRLDLIIPQLAEGAGATEELKAADPMQWVGLMNTCKAQAEEIVKFELIYV